VRGACEWWGWGRGWWDKDTVRGNKKEKKRRGRKGKNNRKK
jgi:hypothetical protein